MQPPRNVDEPISNSTMEWFSEDTYERPPTFQKYVNLVLFVATMLLLLALHTTGPVYQTENVSSCTESTSTTGAVASGESGSAEFVTLSPAVAAVPDIFPEPVLNYSLKLLSLKQAMSRQQMLAKAEMKPARVPAAATPIVAREIQIYSVQVGAYPNELAAQMRMDEVKRLGQEVVLREADVLGRKWYRVMVGNFSTRDEALRFDKQLKSATKIAETLIRRITVVKK